MSIDTSTEIDRRLVERWISMTFTERAILTEALCVDTTMLALAGVHRERQQICSNQE